MDTNIWGPSAWKLLHTIAYVYDKKKGTNETKEKREKKDIKYYIMFLNSLPYILPCEICRTNLKQHYKELPVSKIFEENNHGLAEWMYEIHNMVNKSRNVLKHPSKKQVDKMYSNINGDNPLGLEFLYSVAFTFDIRNKDYYNKFFKSLMYILPDGQFKNIYVKAIKDVDNAVYKYNYLGSRSSITRWIYKLHCEVDANDMTYQDICDRYGNSNINKCSKVCKVVKPIEV